MCGSERSGSRVAVLLTVLLCGWSQAQEVPPLVPRDVGSSSTWYETVASHLCDDPEYLSCLEVSAGQCRRDLEQTGPRQCGEKLYVLTDQPGSAPARQRDLPIPPALVECTLTAHLRLRGRDHAEVHQCLARAKLQE